MVCYIQIFKLIEIFRKLCLICCYKQKESTKSLVGGYYEKFNNEQEKTKILTQSLENSVNEVGDLSSELERRMHQVRV